MPSSPNYHRSSSSGYPPLYSALAARLRRSLFPDHIFPALILTIFSDEVIIGITLFQHCLSGRWIFGFGSVFGDKARVLYCILFTEPLSAVTQYVHSL